MIVSLRHFLGWLVSTFRSREDLVLVNLALRRQLLALHAQQPRRRLTALHKLFWVALRTYLTPTRNRRSFFGGLRIQLAASYTCEDEQASAKQD